MNDYSRLKACIVSMIIFEERLKCRNRWGRYSYDSHKFFSLIGMNDNSIKYRLNKYSK